MLLELFLTFLKLSLLKFVFLYQNIISLKKSDIFMVTQILLAIIKKNKSI